MVGAARTLDRKLLRDLWRLKWQTSAIALLIACGVSVAVMAFSTQRTLVEARRVYYQQTRFGDLFAAATRAPLSLVPALQRIDGVTAVDPRAMKVGLMDVPGILRPATVRLISLPDDERLALNRVVIVAGRRPDPSRLDEALALATFLDAARVAVGERLEMVVAGRKLRFVIVGAALSPEYAYVPSNGPMPDDAHQAVVWAPRQAVENATGLGGAFSTVSLTLAPGASERSALAAIDRALAPYGGTPAYGRVDQFSDQFQQEHIDRLGIMAMIIPPIFLVVAAGLVHLVLGRLVEVEREQIGLLKAFGYDDIDVAMPYLKLAAIIGVVGVAAGGAVGAWVAQVIVGVMAQYVRVPHLVERFSWAAFAGAGGASIAAAIAGSLAAVNKAVRLSPAVAMQPPLPTAFRATPFERSSLWQRLDQPTRMIVRNLVRFPARSVVTTLGLAVSVALLVGSQFIFESIDPVVDREYFRARRWTDQVAFADWRDARAIADVSRLPGVIRAEPALTAPGKMRAHGADDRIVVAGVDDAAELARVLDPDDRRIALDAGGVAVSKTLAARLSLQPGDLVEIELTEGWRPHAQLLVIGISGDYGGRIAYMSRTTLNRIIGQGDMVSGAHLLVRSDARAAFYGALADLPQVVSAGSRADTVASFRSAVSEVLRIEMSFFLGFAAAIAFGIAYNISRVSLANRARDLATLRVIGFRPAECAYILVGELAVLAVPAIPLGVLGGFAQARALEAGYAHQDFYIRLIVTAHGLGISFATYAAALVLAAVFVAQRIWGFDLVAVLKTRD